MNPPTVSPSDVGLGTCVCVITDNAKVDAMQGDRHPNLLLRMGITSREGDHSVHSSCHPSTIVSVDLSHALETEKLPNGFLLEGLCRDFAVTLL